MKIFLTLCISNPWYESTEIGEKKCCNRKRYYIDTWGYINNTINSTVFSFNYNVFKEN